MTTAITKYDDAMFRPAVGLDLHPPAAAVLGELTAIRRQRNGTWKVSHHGQTLLLPASRDKNASDDMLKICRFLKHYNGVAMEMPVQA